MKKIIIIGIIALFVGVGFQPAFANDIMQESENKEKLDFPVIIAYVTELYGTPGNPQYRNLANVTVKIREGLFWMNLHWIGLTKENGRTEEIIVQLGFLYKVIVSKENYIPYPYDGYTAVGVHEIQKYYVNFTMVKDDSPFVKTKSSADNIEKEEDCDCQEVDSQNLIRVKLLMNKLKFVTNILIKRFGYIPEVKEKCEEILDIINQFRYLDFPIICGILEDMLSDLAKSVENFEDFRDKYKDNPIIYGLLAYIGVIYLILISPIVLVTVWLSSFFNCDWPNP